MPSNSKRNPRSSKGRGAGTVPPGAGGRGRQEPVERDSDDEKEDDEDEDLDKGLNEIQDEIQDVLKMNIAEVKRKNKNDVTGMLIRTVKVLKELRKDNENEKMNVENLVRRYNEVREEAESLQKQVESAEETSGLTGNSAPREVTARELSYDKTTKKFLASVVREKIFKRHKMTTPRSFENGEIQRTLHKELGPGWMEEDVLAAYRNALVKLVNYELTQRRNHVQKTILKAWQGEYSYFICY
jgi:hypothetical protein